MFRCYRSDVGSVLKEEQGTKYGTLGNAAYDRCVSDEVHGLEAFCECTMSLKEVKSLARESYPFYQRLGAFLWLHQ